MTRPIPQNLMDELSGALQMFYEDDEAPDGAWWQMMEDTAQMFIDEHKLNADAFDAVHQFLHYRSKP